MWIFFVLLIFLIANLVSSTTFTYTGSIEIFEVPQDINSMDFDLAGAGSSGGSGGYGGRVKGTLSVSPGDILYLYVGGSNGWNGGGLPGCGVAKTGGGATEIRISSQRIIVGGGGGGSGSGIGVGSGGYPTGDSVSGYQRTIGGGSQTSGGSGGQYCKGLHLWVFWWVRRWWEGWKCILLLLFMRWRWWRRIL